MKDREIEDIPRVLEESANPCACTVPQAAYETQVRSPVVAPVVEKGAKTRKVVIPPGTWRADDGQDIVGPTTIEIATPLSRLPYFKRK